MEFKHITRSGYWGIHSWAELIGTEAVKLTYAVRKARSSDNLVGFMSVCIYDRSRSTGLFRYVFTYDVWPELKLVNTSFLQGKVFTKSLVDFVPPVKVGYILSLAVDRFLELQPELEKAAREGLIND